MQKELEMPSKIEKFRIYIIVYWCINLKKKVS